MAHLRANEALTPVTKPESKLSARILPETASRLRTYMPILDELSQSLREATET